MATIEADRRPMLMEGEEKEVDLFLKSRLSILQCIANEGNWEIWAKEEAGPKLYYTIPSSKKGQSNSISSCITNGI